MAEWPKAVARKGCHTTQVVSEVRILPSLISIEAAPQTTRRLTTGPKDTVKNLTCSQQPCAFKESSLVTSDLVPGDLSSRRGVGHYGPEAARPTAVYSPWRELCHLTFATANGATGTCAT